MSAVVAYSSSTIPAASQLSQRIEDLLLRFPVLGADVAGRNTREPCFVQRDISWDPEEILHVDQGDFDVEEVLKRELHCMDQQSTKEPLWQVGLYSTYVTVSVQHELLDGIGLMRLVHALLDTDISSLPHESFVTTRLEDTINVKPSIVQLLPVVWKELILPKLPTWISYYFRPQSAWPTTCRVKPVNKPWDLSVVHVNSAETTRLRTLGKAHNTTLHSILAVAFQFAIWHSLAQKSTVKFSIRTPRSERTEGHPYLTGNYVTAYDTSITPTSGTLFWREAAAMTAYLRSRAGLAAARSAIGMLAYLPKDELPPHPDERRVTAWEHHFLDKLERESSSYDGSFEVSNLGMTSLPPGAEGLVWGQANSPLSRPFNLDVIGSEAGLNIFVSWREGSVVGKEEVKGITDCFLSILGRLTDTDMTINALCE